MPQVGPTQAEFDALDARVARLTTDATILEQRTTALKGEHDALDGRVSVLEATAPPPPDPPDPIDCDLGDEVIDSETLLGGCQPNGKQQVRQVWRKPILVQPEHGGAPCGPTSGERIIERNCTFVPPPQPSPGNHNAHFLAMTARPDIWRSNSLQDPAFFAGNRWVSVDPAHQAAKIIIPPFANGGEVSLAASMSTTDTALTIADPDVKRRLLPPKRIVKVDDEIMVVMSSPVGVTAVMKRGIYNTTPATHAIGTPVLHATNSLRSQVRLPLMTTDGHTYLFGVAFRYGTSFMPKPGEYDFLHPYMAPDGKTERTGFKEFNHKALNFTSGGNDGDGAIWLEPHISFGNEAATTVPPKEGTIVGWDPTQHVGAFMIRSYNRPGGPADWAQSNGNQLGPNGLGPRTDFCLKPDVWAQMVVRLRQRANDYDVVDAWVMDETREAVPVYANGLVSVRPTGRFPNQIPKFWLEFNSSLDDLIRLDQRDFVVHVKHFWALQDPPADIGFALVKPKPKQP